MHDAPVDFPGLRRNLRLIPLALALGIAAGLFVNGYWLSARLPAGSRQLALWTGLVAIICSAAYWLFLEGDVQRLRALPGRPRLVALGGSVLVGAVLLFCGTSEWQQRATYISFLLPSHHLQIQASGVRDPHTVALTWFSTSIGDVSFNSLQLIGWKREGDELVLQDATNNSIAWQGRTGEEAQLLFRASPGDGSLKVAWDSESGLLSPASGRLASSHTFAIPWYASRSLVLGLGVLVFWPLALLLILLVWENRARFAAGLAGSLKPALAWSLADTVVLIGAAALALLLRLPALGRMYPAVDEYFHLIAARQIVEGAPPASVYGRSLWLVTLPVSLAFRAFGFQLWAARVVGAVFNVLAIWPLYLLARRLNRPIAVLSVLLFATSPWIITFARIAREYAYYPFFAYWIIIGMLSFLRGLPERFVLLRDWRTILTPKMLGIGLGLLFPPIFAFYIDPLSTARVMMLAYVVFAGFLLARFDWRSRQNLPFGAVMILAVGLAAYLAYLPDTSRIVTAVRFNPVPLQYFFPNPPQQWYFGRLPILAVLAVMAAAAGGVALRGVDLTLSFLLSLFVTFLAFFTFLSKTFFHTRHLSTTELWYIVIVAAGIYLLWRGLLLLLSRSGGVAQLALGGVLVLSLLNSGQVLLPVTSANPDDAISEDYLHDMSRVHVYMLGHVRPGDVLVSTVYGLYSSWVEQPAFEARYRITIDTPRDDILDLIDAHASGWIVIDQIRLDMSDLGMHAFAGNPDVEYIGLFGDQYVWHWQHQPAGLGHTISVESAQ